MKKLLLTGILTAACLTPLAASAHTNLAIGIGLPVFAPAPVVYAPPPPVYYAPAPVFYGYGGPIVYGGVYGHYYRGGGYYHGGFYHGGRYYHGGWRR